MNVRLSVGLIIFGIIISVIGSFLFLDSYLSGEKEKYFQTQAQKLGQKVEINFERQTHALKGLAGFFHASSFVDADEWKTFELNSSSLSGGESAGYILFTSPESLPIAEKYGLSNEKEASIVYATSEEFFGIDTKQTFKGLAAGAIIEVPKIFKDNRKAIVWPHKKGDELGCFYLTYNEDFYISEAAVQNLELIIVEAQKETPQAFTFMENIQIGSKEYSLIITPGKHFDAQVNFLPYFTVVAFVAMLIFLLIIRIQHLNKQKDRELAERLAHENDILEALNVSTAKYSGEKFFDKLALNLGEVFATEYCFITEIINDAELKTISTYLKREKIGNLCYLKAGTPCEKVVNGELVYHPDNIKKIYPDDAFFREVDMNSYLGAPLLSAEGKVLGLLVLLDKTPIKFNDHLEMVLKIFAERCTVEVERKNSYDALLNSKKELVELKDKAVNASKAKSEFLAVMSHEIRTPLNGIVGSLNLLKETGGLSSEQQDFLNTINFSSDSLIQIINDILDFSKIEAGKMTLEKIPFSLKEIMDAIKCIFIPVADEKGLEFLAPEPANIGNYMGDPGRIRQVIINLVNNALKFTKEGSVVVHTKIVDEGPNVKVSICVEDSGIGISHENQDKIFDSFSQEDSSTTRKFGGTGLGLSICKRLTKMMGGDLSVKSVMGKGSEFTAEFILEKAEENVKILKQRTGVISHFNGKVLLVEDNAVNQKIASKILQKMDIEVDVAENGQIGIDMCQAQLYDLIFMDVMMPVMDGLTATEKLREEGCTIPIVAMTANAFEEDRNKCMAAGMDGFITKPLKKNDIIVELERFLEQAS